MISLICFISIGEPIFLFTQPLSKVSYADPETQLIRPCARVKYSAAQSTELTHKIS